MTKEKKELYEFGEFRLDACERVLWRGAEIVALSPKVFETLLLLVEHEGKIISKSEMMDRIWADTFVEEGNLTQNIYTLRRLLGQDEHGGKFIENVPRRGYRFAAPVRVLSCATAEVDTAEIVVTDVPETNTLVTYAAETNGANQIVRTDAPEFSIPLSSLPRRIVSTESDAPEEIRNLVASVKPANNTRIVFGGVAALAVVLCGFILFHSLPTQSEKTRSTPHENVTFQRLTFTGDVLYPTIAPDGKSFAYVKDGALFVQEIDSGKAVRLNVENAKVFGFLQFTLDGDSICFRDQRSVDSAGDIFQVSRFGGATKTIAKDVWGGFSFAPDGKRLAFIRVFPNENESSLIIKDLESGAESRLVTHQAPDGFSYRTGFPAWSPDGKLIAIAVQNHQHTPASETVVIDVENGGIEEIKTARFRQIEQFAWLPDGKTLLVVARENVGFFQLWRLSYPSGELQRITNDMNIYRAVSLSADGKKLVTRQFTTHSHIWTSSADDLEKASQLTSGNLSRDGMAGIAWTPEGNLIYVTRITGDWDVWSLRPGDGTRQQLTQNSGDFNENPSVTADGKFIFFSSNRSGSKHIWRMDINGENQTQVTFGEKEIEMCPAVSPDGNWLYYLQKSAKYSAVWRKSLTNGKAERLTEQGKLSPDNFLYLSPDGGSLAFQNLTEKINETPEKQILQIAIISTEKKFEHQFFNVATSRPLVHWARDGTAFEYLENTKKGAEIWRQSLDKNIAPEVILRVPNQYVFNFAWSADGKRLATARGQQQNDILLLTNFE